MVCTEIFKKIDEMYKNYFKVWEDCCNIESPTNYKEGVDKVGKYFADLAKERGWKVEYCKQEVAGDVVCITMNADVKNRPISISGHIDTVHPVGHFGTPPVRFDEEKIYGPGVRDCKGGIVVGLLVMDALEACGYSERPVQLLLQSDEETSSMGSNKSTIGYICEKSKDAVVFFNTESSSGTTCTISRKGILSYEFEVTGKEGHSSRCAVEGANAIIDAAHKMIELDKLKDDDGITCNCAVVSGGSVVNTIPGKCIFKVNFRHKTNEQAEWIENYVKELAATVHVPGTSCTVKQISRRVAMEKTDFNEKLLKRANEIYEENGLSTLTPVCLRGGSDGADVTSYGIPCIDSCGVIGGASHSINEFAYLSSLAERAKRIAAVIYNI